MKSTMLVCVAVMMPAVRPYPERAQRRGQDAQEAARRRRFRCQCREGGADGEERQQSVTHGDSEILRQNQLSSAALGS
jgi:hypothetical protein